MSISRATWRRALQSSSRGAPVALLVVRRIKDSNWELKFQTRYLRVAGATAGNLADSTGPRNIKTLTSEKRMLQMSYPMRIYYTDEQKKEMWDRWQKGESMNAIGRLFDRSDSSIQGILSKMGGLPPAPRKRSKLSLTMAEREEISRGVVAGHSLRSIAASLGRAP